jgi:acyl dehydratase
LPHRRGVTEEDKNLQEILKNFGILSVTLWPIFRRSDQQNPRKGENMATRTISGIEELKSLIGEEIGVSDWFEVEQSRINAFADATEDHQWIHLDARRAKTDSPFAATIAHGFLTLSLLPRLAAQAYKVEGDFKMGINYGLNRLRFVSPVPSGSRVRARFNLQSVEDVPGGVQLAVVATVEIDGGKKPALAAEWLMRYYV